MPTRCNNCHQGYAEFKGTLFEGGKVKHCYRCTVCGAPYEREISPWQIDLDDPRAIKTGLPTDEWIERMDRLNA